MSDTVTHNTLIMQPEILPVFPNTDENRNRHTLMILRPYILRRAFGLAHRCPISSLSPPLRFPSTAQLLTSVLVGPILEAQAIIVPTTPSSPETVDFEAANPEGEFKLA